MLAKTPSTLVLLIGGFAYILLCGPAINQHGFPPLDPAWTAMTLLWICPVLLSTVVRRPSRGRYFQEVAVYCVITAMFDAAAVVTTVPKVLDLGTTLLMTLLFFGPLHLAVGFLLVALVGGLRALSRHIAPGLSQRAAKVVQGIAFSVILALAIAFPFAFRQWTFLVDRIHGRTQAEADWMAEDAGVYEKEESPGRIRHEYDPATGLPYRDQWRDTRFSEAYNERVHELIREKGVPPWSMKNFLVPDEELVSLFDADDFEAVTKFPHKVNDNLVLNRGKPGEEPTEEDPLSIGARVSGVISVGGGAPAAVGRRADRPGVIFIRNGKGWIGAFHESGRLLSSASRG